MPDSWTSIGGNTLDWTYELQCHSQKDVLEAIRQAIVERCTVTGTSVPTLLNSAVPPLYNLKSFTDEIQSIITTLIPKFANHTDNSGDWDGQTTIPAWSESSLMTHLSASRLTVAQISALGTWCKQQYEILNHLRWIKKTDVPYTTTSGIQQRRESTEPSSSRFSTANDAWNTASGQWDSGSWTNGWWGDAPNIGRYAEMTKYSDGYYSALISNRGKYTMNWSISTYQASVDLYSVPFIATFSYSTTPTYAFDVGTGWNENAFTLLENIAETSLSSSFDSSLIDPGKADRPADPTVDDNVEVKNAFLTTGTAILKFDGTSGFKFIA
jgi:hypothetical protein